MISESLLERGKTAVRTNTKNKNIVAEITDCLEACKTDLALAGVRRIDEEDPLIIRAAMLYVKAEFGYSDDSVKFAESYEKVKARLATSAAYNTVPQPNVYTVGQAVIVTGTIIDRAGNSLAVSNKLLYVVQIDSANKNGIGLSRERSGSLLGFVGADSLQPVEGV